MGAIVCCVSFLYHVHRWSDYAPRSQGTLAAYQFKFIQKPVSKLVPKSNLKSVFKSTIYS